MLKLFGTMALTLVLAASAAAQDLTAPEERLISLFEASRSSVVSITTGQKGSCINAALRATGRPRTVGGVCLRLRESAFVRLLIGNGGRRRRGILGPRSSSPVRHARCLAAKSTGMCSNEAELRPCRLRHGSRTPSPNAFRLMIAAIATAAPQVPLRSVSITPGSRACFAIP